MVILSTVEKPAKVDVLQQKSTLFATHITPEVLNGTHCSKASDVYSLGKILHELAIIQELPGLLAIAEKCLNANPAWRPTTTGLMASMTSVISC